MKKIKTHRKAIFVAAILLVATFSCKKEQVKNNAAISPVSKALLADSNFVSMSVAGVAAVSNTQLVSHVNSKAVNSTLSLPAKQVLDSLAVPSASEPSYYIFNYVGGGFAIVSADKRVQPIMAYSDNGYFKLSGQINAGLGNWLTVNHKNMQLLRSHHDVKAPKIATKMWSSLLSKKINPANKTNNSGLKTQQVVPDNPPCEEHSEVTGVGPLLQTTWGQGSPYNYLCPVDATYGHKPTGCVATAMAQVMYYWQYPTNYSYSSMPLSYTPTVSMPLAQLMLDAGSSVDMDYSGTNGSSPTVHVGAVYIRADYASEGLKGSFGYTSADHIDYSDGNLFDVIGNLNNHWPVILNASTDNYWAGPWSIYFSGHTWVCDGYNEYYFYTCATPTSIPDVSEVLLYHMNWGWDGSSNGYYYYNYWNVLNGGYQYYQYNRAMDYNIHP